jgi:hypothetical protein
VWGWGSNGAGQLGDGTTTNRSTPVRVLGLSGVTAIAAGQDFSIALESDGAGGGWVWTWGTNSGGQLGDGTTSARNVPIRVGQLSSVSAIAAGHDWALALLADGSVWSWGSNAYGQLGNGTTTSSLVPIRVWPFTNAVAIAAGYWHALAYDMSGRVWGWGNSYNGQLGTNNVSSTYPSSAPQLVPLTAITGMAGGWQHSLTIRTNGEVWAFGNGLLGNGSSGQFYTPISSGLTIGDNSSLAADPDGDTVPTWLEYLQGTDPLNADTNGNGIPDGIEAASGGSAANLDTDHDGVPDAVERQRGTDPFNPDTDGDGVPDNIDAFPLDPTRWQAPTPDPNDHTPPTITLTEPTNARRIS